MREACECTFIGTSHQSLSSIYKSEHSPARTQMFWLKFESIPLFVATHLIRHHVGSQPYQLTCRDDRAGGNPDLKGVVDNIKEQLMILRSFVNNGTFDSQYSLIDSIVAKLDWMKDNTDRETPVNLGIIVNAQSLMDMSKLRLCHQAHRDTIHIFKAAKEAVREFDPDLANYMVAKCVYRNGLCGEPRCCGFNSTPAFKNELDSYLSLFSNKQKGIIKTT